MRKILLTDNENYRKKVDLVRYFKFKNDYFLIYTIGETDEKDYVKLYLVKIMEELGTPISLNIKDEVEWKSMQDVVKRVIKEIKSNKHKLLEDLDPSEIEGVKIDSARFFKLDQKLVNILSSNYNNSNENYIEDLNSNNDTTGLENCNDECNNIVSDNSEEHENNENINMTKIKPIMTNLSNDSSLINSIDYKSLYLAIKDENEAINVAFDDLVNELVKYKEKYGSIEEE